MRTYIRQLAVTAAANSGSNVASITANQNGSITGFQMEMRTAYQTTALTSDTATLMIAEMSFVASSQYQTNDALGVLAVLMVDVVQQVQGSVTTDVAVTRGDKSLVVSGLMVPIAAGDRIYLHYPGSTSVLLECTCRIFMYIK